MSHPTNDLHAPQRKDREIMKKENVFTCITEDLSGSCQLCGKSLDFHGLDYDCLKQELK